MRTRVIVLSAIAALSLVSCKKNSDAVANSGFDYQLKAANPTSVVNRTMATVTWQSGFVNANELKFEAKQNGTETEFKSKVQQHVDLFAALSTIGNVQVPTGTFDEVEFRVAAAPTSTEPAFQLQGTVNSIPVIFRIDNGFEIKAEQQQVTLDGTNTALTTIDLSGLTAGLSAVDFTNAAQTNGTIIISSSSNVGIFNIILMNLQKQGGTEVELHHH